MEENKMREWEFDTKPVEKEAYALVSMEAWTIVDFDLDDIPSYEEIIQQAVNQVKAGDIGIIWNAGIVKTRTNLDHPNYKKRVNKMYQEAEQIKNSSI